MMSFRWLCSRTTTAILVLVAPCCSISATSLLKVDTARVSPGASAATVDIRLSNSAPLAGAEFAVSYNSSKLKLDSLHFTNRASTLSGTGYAKITKDSLEVIVFDYNTGMLAADTGVLATLHFSLDTGLAENFYPVQLSQAVMVAPDLSYDSTNLLRGGVRIGCCIGTRGNVDGDPVDGVDISDLTSMIDFLYISFTPVACPSEGNTNASADGLMDISDLTMLIDNLYISLSPLPNCSDIFAPAARFANDDEMTYRLVQSDSSTVIELSSKFDLRAIKIVYDEKSNRPASSLLGSKWNIYSGKNANSGHAVVGLVDLRGKEILQAGTHKLIQIPGSPSIVSIEVADLEHHTIIMTPTPAGGNSVPTTYALYQNYPNPFNPSTVIRFDLPAASRAKVAVFNILGQQVASLVDEQLPAGAHQVIWDGRNSDGSAVASGVYLYRITTEGFEQSKKMVLLK